MNGMDGRLLLAILFLGAALSVQAKPTVTDTGAAVISINGTSGLRSSIAVDSGSTPHVVIADAPAKNFYFCDLIGNGFSVKAYDATVIFNSSQFGSPHIEIDSADTAWISATFWYPNMGIGICVRPNVKGNPGATPSFNSEDIWDGKTYDVANLSLDPAALGKSYFGSHRGVWEEYTFNPSAYAIYQSANGSVNDGAGGEKAYFWISKAGSVTHAGGATCGVKHHATEWSYNNSLRAAAGLECLKWSDWDYYTGMLNDHAYPSVVSDRVEPQTAYILAEYLEAPPYGIYMNIWHGTDNNGNGYFAFSPQGGLLCLDPSGQTGIGGRYEVQQYPANHGGTWVSWIRSGRAKLRYVPANATSLANCGPEIDVCAAHILSSLCVDRNGDIHMIYYYNNAPVYRRITVAGDGTTWSKRTYLPGDYDGNGYDDLCLYFPSNGSWYIYYNTNGKLTRNEVVNFGWNAARPVPADYDGDGITDKGVYYPALGQWIVFKSKTASLWTTNCGWSDALPMPADYNGDGAAEVAVFYPAQGEWTVRLSASESVVRKLGYSDVIPVPGDYNRDGRDDIAVFVPDSGSWIAVDVRTGGVVLNQNWGWSATRPVPGDYNGDGRSDLCVFHPPSGQWYCNFLNGHTRTMSWGGNDMLPVPGRYRRAHPSFRNMQPALYIPESGTWAMKEFLMDFLSPWYLITNYGWSQALPPAYIAE